MKVKIETVIDIPDKVLLKESEFASAVQLIFDDITNYITCSHLQDAIIWCSKAKTGSPEENKNSTEYSIYKHHEWWGKTCGELDWKYKEIKKE